MVQFCKINRQILESENSIDDGGLSPKISGWLSLDDGLQALVGDDIQQLERGAGRTGFALLPFAYGRGSGVQVMREYWLAELQVFAQTLDISSTELSYRRWADRVELAHRHLVNRASLNEYRQIAEQRFSDLAHNAPPSTHPVHDKCALRLAKALHGKPSGRSR